LGPTAVIVTDPEDHDPAARPVPIEEARARIHHLAYHDSLTGLANRLLLQDRLEIALAGSRRRGGLVAVFFLDLDGFKRINDRAGHGGGDILLIEAAARLVTLLREGDTVARIGGDEFVILISDVGRPADVLPVAEKILTAMRTPFTIDGLEVFITVSIGIAVGPADGAEGEVLVRNADVAMYRAKEQGRDRCELFTPALVERAATRREMEAGLRRVVERGEIGVAFQPVIDIASGHVAGVEALARWSEADRSIAPAEFIPLAEETGMIAPLGRHVLRQACLRASRWRCRDGARPALSVNVSPAQLRNPNFVPELATILGETAYPPRSLILEISERAAAERLAGCLEAMREIQRLGVGVALDDFGGGGSSLDALRRFEFDVVKIDPSLTRGVPREGRDAAIARAVLRLGHQLGFSLIAEGVERPEQLEFLRYHRCPRAQGYLIAAPGPPEVLDSLLS
jgi:diguanylate cyclase (GGDEF)-like protein